MDRPNVLLIMADQHRWDFIGYERNGVTLTPNLDRLAAAGTVFNAAYCTAPLCSPSRAAIASGRYGMNTGCFTNLHELPPGTPSFVQQFRQSGYRTCAIGKTHMEIHAYDSDLTSETHRQYMDSLGWDEICETAGDDLFRHGIRDAYSAYLEATGSIDDVAAFYDQWHYFMQQGPTGQPSFACHEWNLPHVLHGTDFVGQQAVDWLRQADLLQPFLLHVGFTAPHSPIAPLPEYMDAYRARPETSPWANPQPPDWLPDGRRGYRAMISHVDRYVGELLDCLADRGIAENTIVVYLADHGEMAGDHGQFAKTCFFEGAMRVPFILAGPGIAAQPASSALVETIDIGKTLCDLASVEPHRLDQGRSLMPILAGVASEHRTTVYAEMGCDRMLRDQRYKLMWGDPHADDRQLGRLHLDKPVDIPPSPVKLFDLQDDPHELRDLSSNKEHAPLRMQLMEKLLLRWNENTQTQPNRSRGQYRPLHSRGSNST